MAKAKIVTFCAMLGLAVSSFGQKHFKLQGTYVEGCACEVPCSCDLKGMMAKGCQVIGAIFISKGQYGGDNLSGCRVTYIASSGWVKLYYHVDKGAQTKPLRAMAMAYFSGYGKIQSMVPADIELSGVAGKYTVTVDGGKIARVKIAPILGEDGKTAVVYKNYPDPFFSQIMQGKTITGAYKGAGGSFSLKDSNAFFNPNWKTHGKI